MRLTRTLSLAAGVAALSLFALPAGASETDAFKDKMVSIVIGYPAGSAYVTYAQLVQRHIAKQLPGNPNVITKFMPGAGSLIAANYLYEVAPKDGTVIGALGRGTAVEPLMQGAKSKAKFDPRKFVWLASLNNEVAVGVAWHTSGIKTFEDTLKKELIIGIGGEGGDANVFAHAMNNIMGTKFKLVCCYHGSSEQDLAMERGETGGRLNFSWAHLKRTKTDWLKDGKVNLIVQLALEKHRELPNVPLVLDLVKDPEDHQLMEVVFSRQAMGRPFAAPPGLTAERAATLRTAFDHMLVDKEFLADADKMKIEINEPMPGVKVNALLDRLYSVSDATRKKLQMLETDSGKEASK
jgi:tripartite-type tricarboxylate transporter receptor subunit TctC